jgi:hypothetical protein
MRIWSLHPKYLDTKGLVALWRETLLAKHVLEGRTKGYLNHPQLERFKKAIDPLDAIHGYLAGVFKEAQYRQFDFDVSKFRTPSKALVLTVTEGQLTYEFEHLLAKLKVRDPALYKKVMKNKVIETHPLFKVIAGKMESWERVPI